MLSKSYVIKAFMLSFQFLTFRFFAEQIYVDTQPLVRSVLDGYNVCIFAYGQTGSGKTYTMVILAYFQLRVDRF